MNFYIHRCVEFYGIPSPSLPQDKCCFPHSAYTSYVAQLSETCCFHTFLNTQSISQLKNQFPTQTNNENFQNVLLSITLIEVCCHQVITKQKEVVYFVYN